MFELEIGSIQSDVKDEKNFVSERLSLFRKIIESLADIVEQMEIKATDKGLAIQVMDSMHVALADVFLAKDLFTSFRCDRDIHLGIPAKHFLAILRGIIPTETSVVKFSCEDSPQILTIQHIIEDAEYRFDITLYQISSENYTVPHMEYACSIKMPSEQFRSVSKLIGSFGEYIQLKCERDTFFINQKAELTKNTMSLKSNEKTVFINSTEPVGLEIAMKYVTIVNKVCSLSNELTINLSGSAPVYFDIKLFDHLGFIRFYVAPKIDE